MCCRLSFVPIVPSPKREEHECRRPESSPESGSATGASHIMSTDEHNERPVEETGATAKAYMAATSAVQIVPDSRESDCSPR